MTESLAPLRLAPSGLWDGNDGRWSTFALGIGNPSQIVRLLPGTSATAGDSIWAVLPEGCFAANPGLDNCTASRGGAFDRNESDSWSTERLAGGGLYELNTFEESKLGLTGNAYYGFEAVDLGLDLPTMQHQLIAGIAGNDFWLGSLGLSPLPLNFTAMNDPVPSLLGSLRDPNNTIIPSTTWSYTAGAVYRDTLGSVILGGFDNSRVDTRNSISVGFGIDQSRDLVISLQSITYDTYGSSPLLVEDISIFMNSLATHLWLPLTVCHAFEEAFGLEWDDEVELYLLNDTTHAQLRAQNPTFTFTIGDPYNSASRATIQLPYAAFDHNVSAPFVNGSQPYFPLHRAQNDRQYTLGRVFLQEAYVIADYDRKNFTVGQALFPSPTSEDLVAIQPPSAEAASGTDGANHQKGHQLSRGAIAGIVVTAVVVLAISVIVVLVLRRRRSKRKLPELSETSISSSPPMPPEADPSTQIAEKPGAPEAQEMAVDSNVHQRSAELVGNNLRIVNELPAANAGIGKHELEASLCKTPRRVELEANSIDRH